MLINWPTPASSLFELQKLVRIEFSKLFSTLFFLFVCLEQFQILCSSSKGKQQQQQIWILHRDTLFFFEVQSALTNNLSWYIELTN